MKFCRRPLALLLTLLTLSYGLPSINACGPSFIEPIFVFKESPDLPFTEFAAGKLGIVQPRFGRKTLVIAYRYLNDRAFGSEEQKGLVEALNGKPPEDEGNEAVKTWVLTRKQFMPEGEKLPEIYTERQYGGYDFFPNCTKNAFEVATETLKDRVGSYGADDKSMHAWLTAQDTVFQNCGGGENKPAQLGAESPAWLRQDRDYQVGAALLYSLNFDAARAQFERIAADNESPWQQTADYLVARTLVRQASFAKDDAAQNHFYEQAEGKLQVLLGSGGKFSGAARRMLGLVKYRLRPEERVRELARILATETGNENLRQDLIDYVWLLDKFQAEALKEEEKRKAAQDPAKRDPDDARDQFAAREETDHGESIDINFENKQPADTNNDSRWLTINFKFDVSEDEVFQEFEVQLKRKLTPEDIAQLRERHSQALAERKWRLSPNQKWNFGNYEGSYQNEKFSPDLLHAFVRSDELTDWIFTFQSDDPASYTHALSRWRRTNAPVWLLAVMTKTEARSPWTERLLRASERVSRDAPIFASLAFQRVRLLTALGRTVEARKLLDDIISWQENILPISAQNQFLEQRTALASSLSEFLKFAPRRPVTFLDEGRFASLKDIKEIEKRSWNSEYARESREEFEKEIEEDFRELLPWDERVVFDEQIVEIFNWHFPLQLLLDAARDPELPDYLRTRLTLAVWTRAILLKNDGVALSVTSDVVKSSPNLSALFLPYAQARTPAEREAAALFILLKQPSFSPFVADGLPRSATPEDLSYRFESSWWCPLSLTDYNDDGNEVPKVVSKPTFLTTAQSAAAARERVQLIAIGDGKSYLGKRVIEWAKRSPADERLPEALFIAAKANRQYKYGCNSWEFDNDSKQKLEALLRGNYPDNPWTLKLGLPGE